MGEKLLSKEQVNTVLEFSDALRNYGLSEGIGFWTPWMSNQLLRDLTGQQIINNDSAKTIGNLRKALGNYKENITQIQGYMDFANSYDMIFARTVESYINSLSFDLQVICENAYSPDEYNSDEYKEDKKRINDFLLKFDYKKEFRNVLKQVLLRETYYTWFRKTKWGNKGMKFALQILPQDRCMLTGYWEKGLLFDFDMSYFLMAGTDLDGYDPAFKKYYNRVFGDASAILDYRPTNSFNKRDGTYAMWTQTSPDDGAWCFKFDTSDFTTVPFLAPFLKDILSNDQIEQMQYDKDISEAYAILAGEIETFDTAKSGTVTDQTVFKPSTLGGFMAKAKAGLENNTKMAAVPLKNLKWYQFEDKNPEMYQNKLSTTAGIGTGISRVIYSTDRMSNAEVEAAMNETYQTMKPMYYQFSNFMEFFANKLTKRYKFKFIFDGATYRYERDARFERILKLADKGIVLSPSVWASVIGMNPVLFENSLIESKVSGWTDNLQLLLNTNTTAQENVAGRPRTDYPDDSTDRNEDM